MSASGVSTLDQINRLSVSFHRPVNYNASNLTQVYKMQRTQGPLQPCYANMYTVQEPGP